MKHTAPAVSPVVSVYPFPTGARWVVRIATATHVFLGLYMARPSRSAPTPVAVEVYSVRRGKETFLGYASESLARLQAVFAAIVEARSIVVVNPQRDPYGRTTGALFLDTQEGIWRLTALGASVLVA